VCSFHGVPFVWLWCYGFIIQAASEFLEGDGSALADDPIPCQT